VARRLEDNPSAMNTSFDSGLSRRGALRLGLGSLAAALLSGAWSGRAFGQTPKPTATPASAGPYTLAPLPYAYNALEPYIDEFTMHLHHDKHEQAYVDNANKLLVGQTELAAMAPEELLKNLTKAPEEIRTGLRNNVGGVVNHNFFWKVMSPKGGGKPTGDAAKLISGKFGSFEVFQEKFNEAALKRFGSGWAWLVLKDGQPEIVSTANQDSPISDGQVPLLGLDVWEHAYYLKYQNRRAEYIKAWWNLVNWDFVNQQLKQA